MNDDELLNQAVAGDMDALSGLLRKLGPDVRRWLKPQMSDKHKMTFDLDDVMSVTYCEAFRGIKGFVPSKGVDGFVAWLKRVAKHNLLDAVKELERDKRVPRSKILPPRPVGDESYVTFYGDITGTGTTASQHMAKGDARRILENAISQLPPDYQRVVRMYDLEGMDIADVAEAMERSVGAVYMMRARAAREFA